jgi:hypothetical protein
MTRGVPMLGNTTIRCGNCYYWDRENLGGKGSVDRDMAPCLNNNVPSTTGISGDVKMHKIFGCIFFEPLNCR